MQCSASLRRFLSPTLRGLVTATGHEIGMSNPCSGSDFVLFAKLPRWKDSDSQIRIPIAHQKGSS
jgi:hypothetical protein